MKFNFNIRMLSKFKNYEIIDFVFSNFISPAKVTFPDNRIPKCIFFPSSAKQL